MIILRLSLATLLWLLTCQPWSAHSHLLQVEKTLVNKTTAASLGAYCLDGSLPAYHLSRGYGSGINNWLLHFEGGGWCNDVESCWARTSTRRGSSHYMDKVANMTGILSDRGYQNPDFYTWNRVFLRYCDGASFAGNSKFDNGTTVLYFRGQKIWQAVVQDLLSKGMAQAEMALLSGGSAGGVATFLHCDDFTSFLPSNTTIKCLADAGFFLDARDIANNYTIRSFYHQVINLQGVEQNLDQKCTSSLEDPKQCFFPQYLLRFIKTPLFILNAAYDVWQFYNILVPYASGPGKEWGDCKHNLTKCTDSQIQRLTDFRNEMLEALFPFYQNSTTGGMYINSCFAHGQSEFQDTWYGVHSPMLFHRMVAEAAGDWYFERRVTKLIEGPYPCDKTCHNLIPQ